MVWNLFGYHSVLRGRAMARRKSTSCVSYTLANPLWGAYKAQLRESHTVSWCPCATRTLLAPSEKGAAT